MHGATCALHTSTVSVVDTRSREDVFPVSAGKTARRWASCGALALICSVAIPRSAAAQEYLSGIPAPTNVVAAYAGPDSLDRTARQHAALRVIRGFVADLQRDRVDQDRKLGRPSVEQTPGEQRVQQEYATADREIVDPAFEKAQPRRGIGGAVRRQWFNRISQYAMVRSPFAEEVLQRFFSPEWISQYEAARERLSSTAVISDSALEREERESRIALGPPPPAFRGAPVPADQRRFAASLYTLMLDPWCRSKAANDANPIATELARTNFYRRLDESVRAVGTFRGWMGIIESISIDAPPNATIVILVDTVSSYRGPRDEAAGGSAVMSAELAPNSPAYVAASRLQVGERVVFSGRMLTSVQILAADDFRGSDEPSEGGALRCRRMLLQMTAADLRPAP